MLFAAFQGNKAAQLFGPVIVLMLFFNLFAQLILFVAAWIATADHEAISTGEEKVRFALTPESERDAASRSRAEPVMVPQQVAARSVQVGLGAGYVTGAATGVGLGAALAWLVSKAVRGRRADPCCSSCRRRGAARRSGAVSDGSDAARRLSGRGGGRAGRCRRAVGEPVG